MSGEVSTGGLFALIAFLLFLSAFFSGSETALMSLNRYQLRHKAREGVRGAILAEKLLQQPDRLIGLILLGNNLVNFSASALVARVAYEYGGDPAIAVGTVLLTLVVLVFSETAPKTLAALHPEAVAFPASHVYYPLLKVAYPFVWSVNLIANGVLRLFGVRQSDGELPALTREELRTVVSEASGRISNRYRQMLVSILDLEKVTVDDVMIPHNEIIGIDLAEDEAVINRIINESEHTRLPVYDEDIDKVVGVLHLRHLANLSRQAVDRETIQSLLKEPYFVPEGTPLSTQLVQFQRRRERIALVVDEYGDIQGIVTLEDILEEIVGEFTTDPADDGPDIVHEASGTYLVNASINLRDLNRALKWLLPTEGPKTLNGLIVEQLEEIPAPATILSVDGYPIEIVSVNDNRIETVRIRPRVDEDDEQ